MRREGGMPNIGVLNASLAGLFAAFAGITAKFALSSDSPEALLRICDQYFPENYVRELLICFILLL